MDPNKYVQTIIAKYAIVGGRTPAATLAAKAVYSIVQKWAHAFLLNVSYSGSSAKGTAISGTADVDLFISLKPETPGTLAEIYNSLANYAGLKPFAPRRQNVSIGIKHSGQQIDLVPGRKQSGNTTDHSLYKSKTQTWTQTNVDKHIALIQNSQRLDEIRAIKIWRVLHGLDFSSFYLEMSVIEALKGKKIGNVASNVAAVLEYLRDYLETAVIVDPANSNNKISDDITGLEKKRIAQKAAAHLKANWNQVLW